VAESLRVPPALDLVGAFAALALGVSLGVTLVHWLGRAE
jgi:hypothetical protein